jgi:hypothetical protein
MNDNDGTPLQIGDEVTVVRSDHAYIAGSSGFVENLGTKLVHVRITASRHESDVSRLVRLPPQHVLRGVHHVPTPVERWANAVETFLASVLDDAVSAGIITEAQRDAILRLQAEG